MRPLKLIIRKKETGSVHVTSLSIFGAQINSETIRSEQTKSKCDLHTHTHARARAHTHTHTHTHIQTYKIYFKL
jgi:hypothetical protein